MHENLSLSETQKEWRGSVKSYLYGFISSLILTSLSFFIVISEKLTKDSLIYSLAILALVQAACQLIFFLHIGKEAHPRWKLFTFLMMIVTLLIIALGSIWIMHDLNARMMPEMH